MAIHDNSFQEKIVFSNRCLSSSCFICKFADAKKIVVKRYCKFRSLTSTVHTVEARQAERL